MKHHQKNMLILSVIDHFIQDGWKAEICIWDKEGLTIIAEQHEGLSHMQEAVLTCPTPVLIFTKEGKEKRIELTWATKWLLRDWPSDLEETIAGIAAGVGIEW